MSLRPDKPKPLTEEETRELLGMRVEHADRKIFGSIHGVSIFFDPHEYDWVVTCEVDWEDSLIPMPPRECKLRDLKILGAGK